MAKQNTRQVSIFINGKEVENSIRGIAAEQSRLNNKIKDSVIGTDEYKDAVKGLAQTNTLLREHRQAVSGLEKGWSLSKVGIDKFIGVAAGAFAVENLLGYGKQLFGVGVQMDALNRKAQTVFGVTLPAVTAEAKKNGEAMGLTTSQYVAQAAAIQDILVPMGFQRKEASEISTQLVNLSGALSEWTGGQVSATEVSDILSSALTGERERLKQLGIVLQQADIDARLAEKGQSKLTGSMKQQAEAAATLELVLEKSTDAQAAFANGSDSAVRRQAELTAKIQEITEKLATLLLPVFEKLAAFAGSVVGAVSDVVDGLDSLVHPAKAASKAFDEQAEKVADLEGNIVPLLDRYDELTGKSNLSKKEQNELKKIIDQVSGAIPTAISGFDAYGRALSLNTAEARGFIEAEKDRLKFINQAAIAENEALVKELEQQAAVIKTKLETGRGAKPVFSTTGVGTRLEFQDLTGSEIQKLQAEAATLQTTLNGAVAQVKFLKGERLNPTPVAPTDTPTGGGGKGDPEKAKKEAERIQNELTDLIEKVANIRRDLISKEQEDELAIAINGIEDRYKKEIDKALELENKGVTEATAQRIALEQLKQEEITVAIRQSAEKSRKEQEKSAYDKSKKLAQVELDAWEEGQDFLEQRQKEREEVQKDADKFKLEAKKESKANETKAELEELDKEYQELLKKADDYFNSDLDLQAAYNERKNELIKKQKQEEKDIIKDIVGDDGGDIGTIRDKKDKSLDKLNKHYDDLIAAAAGKEDLIIKLKEEKAKYALEITAKAMDEELRVYAASFRNIAASLSDAFTLFSEDEAAFVRFQKVLALIQIGIDTATAISGIVAAAASTSITPIDLAIKIATGTALVFANIAKAKKLLTDTPEVPQKTKQKADGGYLSVTGETDGRRYNASVIPTPYTGLLPPHPVLFQSQATGAPVLASERGAEYFVSAEALRNPYVANLTRMIDNITLAGGRGVRQFADGGANVTPPIGGGAGGGVGAGGFDAALIGDLAASIATLNSLLARGIVAVIPDRTLTAIPERLGKINDNSGGFFG